MHPHFKISPCVAVFNTYYCLSWKGADNKWASSLVLLHSYFISGICVTFRRGAEFADYNTRHRQLRLCSACFDSSCSFAIALHFS